MNQRGFATLEVILMVMVIGILASIAVPRFTTVTASANTAKIQADLATLDTAIAIHYMEKGAYPTKLSDLKDYVHGVENDTNPDLKPPTGKAYVKDNGTSKEETIASTDKYGLNEDKTRAVLKTYTSEKFTTQKPSSSESEEE